MRRRLSRPLSFLLLPLSLVPIVLAVPQIARSQRNFERIHKSGPLPVPAVAFSAAQRERYQPLPAVEGRIPVLVYRGINDDNGDPRSIGRERFAAQMALLSRLGFRGISMRQYLAFRRGIPIRLPARPVLITFDGGRLDSYRGADRVLARYGMRATMFIVTGKIDDDDMSHLRWAELKSMRNSGRWDIEVSAAHGDGRIAYDANGATGPYYAVRRFTRSEGLETFADFERRVTEDIFAAKETLAAHGFEANTVAVPYSNYGQRSSNDPRIGPFMRELLHRQYDALFIQDTRNAPSYSAPGANDAVRYEVNAATTVDRLYMWLRDNHPNRVRAARAAAERAAKAKAERERRVREKRAALRRARERRTRAARRRAEERR